jgi:hypothetical protein
MRQKERHDNKPPTGSGGNPGSVGSGLDQLREQANRFLAAGDAAIDRALANTDSVTFLRANRQQGGE